MKIRRISLTRRIVQIFCLIILIYGGYLFKHQPSEVFPALKPPEDSVSTTKFARGNILWPSGDTPVLENFPPSLICRFNPKGGMFKACILHFISENLTWQTRLKFLLPHLFLFVLLCFLFGRMWCGWACPIGTVGDLLTWLRRKMNIPVKRFPQGFSRSLRFSSYGIIFSSLGISTLIGMPNFAQYQCYLFLPYCQICPARLICPLFGFIKPSWKDFSTIVPAVFTLLAWIVLAIFIAAFYWGRRVWCHLCPVGLINSFFNRGCGVELRKKAIKCNKCGYCADACPMGLTNMYEEDEDRIFNQNGCIMCMKCVEICPREDCLSVRFFGRKVIESKFRSR